MCFECVYVYTRVEEKPQVLFFYLTFSPKDSMGEFNLSKTDLNIFPLPFAVCGHQHRLQEPEERGS